MLYSNSVTMFNFAKPDLSIIIPYHNEGSDFINETIKSIKETIDVSYEIIVIDDYSDIPLQLPVKVIRHSDNLGVGAAFDTGVKIARSNNLFLMGCDVRFVKNQWASKIVAEIKKHPKSLICTSVVSLWAHEPQITFEQSRKIYKYNGATILMLHGHNDTPDQPQDFQSILNAQWMPREYLPLRRPGVVDRTDSYEIPCILGAAYGVTKKWYNHIDGFWGHKKWGTLEPYISLKSYLFGGNCLTAPHIETAHIFKVKGTHNTGLEFVAYNKLLTSWLLFSVPDKDRLINHLKEHDYVLRGKELIAENLQDILKKRDEYRKKTVFSIKQIVDKFNLTF